MMALKKLCAAGGCRRCTQTPHDMKNVAPGSERGSLYREVLFETGGIIFHRAASHMFVVCCCSTRGAVWEDAIFKIEGVNVMGQEPYHYGDQVQGGRASRGIESCQLQCQVDGRLTML